MRAVKHKEAYVCSNNLETGGDVKYRFSEFTLRASGNAPEGGRETALFGVRFWASKKVPLECRGRYRPAINMPLVRFSFFKTLNHTIRQNNYLTL